MEPSRDDFIIALRSAFLKKGTQQRFSLLSLIFFSIILLILSSFNFKIINFFKIGINEVIYRTSFIASLPENLIKKNYKILQDHNNLFTNYKDNLEQLDRIKSNNLSKEIIEYENIRLKQIIDDYIVVDKEIFAKVLIDKKSPFLKSIIINKGSRNNIKLGMAVLDGIYFIGKVVELNYSTSRILLISDINSKIPVSLEPIGVQAIMSGNGEMNGIIEYVNQSNLESENTNLTVFTSGMGGLFKSGIPIGRIIKEKNTSNITSNVNFYKDLSQLKYVKILSYKKENLNLEIENSQDRNVEILQETNNQNYLFKEQQKISNEIRVKLEQDKILLNKELTKLKKEISKLKKDVQNQIIEDEKTLIDADELKFLKLNFLYSKKCTKTFYNKLYKVGSAKYKKCILNKGKN
jgi:rod shape-determining protein MreC